MEGCGIDAAFRVIGAGAIVAASEGLEAGGTVELTWERGAIGIAGLEVVEGGEMDAAFSIVRTRTIVAACEVSGAGGTVGLIGERRVARYSVKVSERPAGGLSMARSSSIRRWASSVRSRDIQGRLLIASRMYLICSVSESMEGPEHDRAIKGLLVELASSSSSSQSHGGSLTLWDCIEGPGVPIYPSGSVIEFLSEVNFRHGNLHL
ncbi:hypothetical protein B9Z19DRAFT_986481 [Tuber borchii]|uniref:Uncharacterized protein n=1 Tax=Tuber borchii TaxID=42251 RepID=A0A2T6ZPX6_TUBBO|nr:hypothetical protein B9Z19DRAFT_986481 [Tuber borchii]